MKPRLEDQLAAFFIKTEPCGKMRAYEYILKTDDTVFCTRLTRNATYKDYQSLCSFPIYDQTLSQVETRNWRCEAQDHPRTPIKVRGSSACWDAPSTRSTPDATLVEHCQFWEATRGIQVSSASMSRAIWRLIWTRMKKTLRALRGKESVLVRSVQHPRMLAHSHLVSPPDALLLLARSARETHGLPLARARSPGANDGHPCQCPDCDQPEG
jgi:hypothetical protein